MPSKASAQPPPLVTVRSLDLNLITVDTQHRRHFDPLLLESLAQSIREVGVLQPLIVREHQESFRLISGERRWRAAFLAGLSQIPAVVLLVQADLGPTLSAVENLQRVDLNPLEQTDAVVTLCALALGISREDTPKRLGTLRRFPDPEATAPLDALFLSLGCGRWQSFVANRLPLLNMPPDVQGALREGSLAYTKARKIARVRDPEVRSALLEETERDQLSTGVLTRRVKEALEAHESPHPNSSAGLEEESEAHGSAPEAGVGAVGAMRGRLERLSRARLERLDGKVRTRLDGLLLEAEQLLGDGR